MRILLIGPAGSGKSTIAYWLMKEYGFKEFALGDKVKELTFLLLIVLKICIILKRRINIVNIYK